MFPDMETFRYTIVPFKLPPPNLPRVTPLAPSDPCSQRKSKPSKSHPKVIESRLHPIFVMAKSHSKLRDEHMPRVPAKFGPMARNIQMIPRLWETLASRKIVDMHVRAATILSGLSPNSTQSARDGEEWSEMAPVPQSHRKRRRDVENEDRDLAPPTTRRRTDRGSPQIDLGPDSISRDFSSTKIAILPIALLGEDNYDETITRWVATMGRIDWTAAAESVSDGLEADAALTSYATEPCRSGQESSWRRWMPTWGDTFPPDTSQFTSNDWAVFIETTNLTGGPNRR